MDDRTMRNWGVAATAGALGIAVLVAAQSERPASQTAPVAGAGAQFVLPDDPAAPGGSVSPNAPVAPVNKAGAPAAPKPTDAKPKDSKPGQEGAAPAKPQPVAVLPADASEDIGEAINPNLEFIVRFQGQSGLAKAQAQFAAGDRQGAVAAARAAVAAAPALRGLCFSKFTLGAEMVLAHCQAVPPTQLKLVSERWTRRLNAMGDVDYADANVILKNENPIRAPR
jgi:hypothetical protein